MKCTIKAFGITKDIIGKREIEIEVNEASTVADLKQLLESQYPELKGLRSLFIAVNNSYAKNETVLAQSDEIALIPPVSGG